MPWNLVVYIYMTETWWKVFQIWIQERIHCTSGNISEEAQNTNSKEYMTLYFHCSVIYHSQDLEAAQLSITE